MSQASIDRLLKAVEKLSSRERDEFEHRLAQRRFASVTDEQLVRTIQRGLDVAELARLRALISRSEAGRLSVSEQQEYRELAQHSERINAERVAALAELVRRWGEPMHVVMKKVGWHARRHGA